MTDRIFKSAFWAMLGTALVVSVACGADLPSWRIPPEPEASRLQSGLLPMPDQRVEKIRWKGSIYSNTFWLHNVRPTGNGKIICDVELPFRTLIGDVKIKETFWAGNSKQWASVLKRGDVYVYASFDETDQKGYYRGAIYIRISPLCSGAACDVAGVGFIKKEPKQ